jgi:hypothetical protein
MTEHHSSKSDIDKLESMLRKKPQVGKPVSKIPLDNDKYPQLWFEHQEDLVKII